MGNKKRDWVLGSPIISKYYETLGLAYTHKRVTEAMGYVPKSAVRKRAMEMGIYVNKETVTRLSAESNRTNKSARKLRCMVEVSKNYRKHGPAYCAESIFETKNYVMGVAGFMNIKYEKRVTNQKAELVGYRYPVDMDDMQALAAFMPWRPYSRERCSDSVAAMARPR